MGRQVYVETLIRADLDTVWSYSQDPERHQRWDARFLGIEYLPGTEPQAFRYRTVAGEGVGVAAGERHRPDGTRTSALRFTSWYMTGAGYWRYVPASQGVRFLTGYDYTLRWTVLDVLVRPLIGWATAWSFDRLRIWLEYGVPPERSRRLALWRPGPRTPAARRCPRRPPDRDAARPPSTLERLEVP